MTFELPDLPYSHNSLSPHIDEQTMKIHHGKHHQGYINKLNDALSEYSELQDKFIEELLTSIETVPETIRTAVRNNGGGHANHSLFWKIMTPDYKDPSEEFHKVLKQSYGSLDNLKEEFNTAAMSRFGSGWAWLVINKNNLEIYSTANQDSPLMKGHFPILGIDVWEHAYYLNYQNKRAEYIESWWNVVNWKQVEENYKQASS